MCACRLGASSPVSPAKLDIEDYYMMADSVGGRYDEGRGGPTPGDEDLYAQLEQKDRDLTLAAELGKALLEKNAELERRNEILAEEFTLKLEALEQEKYELHLKLEKTEAEYENTIKELQYDICQLRHELQTQQHQSTTEDKDKADLIKELGLQNERLQEESQRAAAREEELAQEVQSLKDQMTSRRSSMHFHINQLETLQEEITLLTRRKAELERRIAVLLQEKESILCHYEESQDTILELEKQNKEKEQEIQSQQRDMLELQENNMQLQLQIHHMTLNSSNTQSHPQTYPQTHTQTHPQTHPHLHHHSGGSGDSNTDHRDNIRLTGESLLDEYCSHGSSQSQSLFHELSEVNSSHGSEDSQSHSLFEELSHYHPCQQNQDMYHNQMTLSEMMMEDDFECDDEDDRAIEQGLMSSGANCSSSGFSETQFLTSFQNSSSVMDIDSELQTDLVQAYRQIKQMCREFRREHQRPRSVEQEEDDDEEARPHRLVETLEELRELMYDIMSPKSMSSRESQVDLSEEGIVSVSELQRHIQELQTEVSGAQEDLERVRRELQDRDQKLRDKTEEMRMLTNKLSMQHEELVNVQCERERLQHSCEEVNKDEILQQAKKDRDLAVEKQNKMEMELAKTKMEVLRLNSKLMETIQQKVSLSKQLEQWQVDVEKLLDTDMDERLQKLSNREEIVERLTNQIKMKKSKSASFAS